MKVMGDLKIDLSVKSVNWIKPGESFANKRLRSLNESFKNDDLNRNDPTKNALSNLSP